MKRLCLMTIAALTLASCGGKDDIKLDDQTGFHQAVDLAGEHGRAVASAKNYNEFKSARKTVEDYAEAFKTQLGGESYLTYLKCVTSAIGGSTLSEIDIDADGDIAYLRQFYKTTDENSVSNSVSVWGQRGIEYIQKIKECRNRAQKATTQEEKDEAYGDYLKLCEEIKGIEAQLAKEGNMNAYIDFVYAMVEDIK